MKLLKLLFLLATVFLAGSPAYAQGDVYKLDEEYAIDQGGTVHLTSDDADVTIEGTNRSNVHVLIYRNIDVDGWKIASKGDFSVEVEERGGDLYIREENSEEYRMIFGSIDEEYRITLEVPTDVSLDLNGDDENYEISDIEGDIRINADDSDIDLRNMMGEEFDFDIDDGSIRLDEARGLLKLRMDDGSLSVRRANFTEIDADMDDGEIDITTSLDENGRYWVDMDDGDLELNIAGGGGEFDIHHDNAHIRADNTFEELQNDEHRTIYRLSGGNARFEIDTDDGHIDLRTL